MKVSKRAGMKIDFEEDDWCFGVYADNMRGLRHKCKDFSDFAGHYSVDSNYICNNCKEEPPQHLKDIAALMGIR